MGIIERIKEIIFKIKDYDRLQSDYCTCLCYFTNNKMSKPNYKIEDVKVVISDSIGEYMDEGYNAAVLKAVEWLEEHTDDNDYTWYDETEHDSGITDKFIEDFKKYMEE